MKHAKLYLSILTCCSAIFAFAPTVASCAEVEPGVVEARQSVPDCDQLNYVLKTCPSEIKIGDPIYYTIYFENTSEETVKDVAFCYCDRYAREKLHWELRSPDGVETYRFLTELWSHPGFGELRFKQIDYTPHEERIVGMGVLETPSLEDFEQDFWKKFEETLPPEGVECTLSLTDCRHRKAYQSEITIRIKPRPESERRLLQTWLEQTPDQNKPSVSTSHGKEHPYKRTFYGDRLRAFFHSLASGSESDIQLGNGRYRPQLFMRFGNRKPSVPNNPTTLDGWRELETKFEPSTLLDEIRLVRFQLEYYDAPDGEASETALNALLSWLETLPGPQRIAILGQLAQKADAFIQKPDIFLKEDVLALKDKNARLIKKLEERFGKQDVLYSSWQ